MAIKSFVSSGNASLVYNSQFFFFFFNCVFLSWRFRVSHGWYIARDLSAEGLKTYLEERVYPKLAKKRFAVLYLHTGVQRSENFVGISALRSIYDAIPSNVRDNLQAVYFLHPGLQARLFLATFGRLFFHGGWVELPVTSYELKHF